MDVIHLLPDHVANQIAAGEVIQRPASCLKELVENSLDAGATRIQVIVRDAGRTLLQVVDNGKGMSPTDARMAFERHATSKIQQVEDLFALRTMGFRGEALASICAVAQVEMTTRRAEDEVGYRLHIDGSQTVTNEPCSCAQGTNIRVKNLFYNIPVRRKFLKTDQTELRNLLTEFYHIVLVYPKVHFQFVSNDEILLELPPSTEKQRIEAIFGKGTGRNYAAQLLDVKTDTDLVSVRGFVSKPEACSKSGQQYFFVNGRYMRHPYFNKAILTAYSGMLPGEYVPSYFIYFDIHPEAIDVNIHPTKTEIKFADEQAVFQILMAAVREALGKFELAPTIDFDRRGEIEMPVMHANSSAANAPKMVIDPAYNPFRTAARSEVMRRETPTGWQSLYSTPRETKSVIYPDETPIEASRQEETEVLWGEADPAEAKMMQLGGKYILAGAEGGLLVINQHRAHVCVLYDAYMRLLAEQDGTTQQLLFPEVMELTTDEVILIDTIVNDLHSIGFELNQLSPTAYTILGIPAQATQTDAITMLRDILVAVKDATGSARIEWQKKIALSMAESNAIAPGKPMSEEEMRHLVRQLMALKHYRNTPDGKRVMSLMTLEELARRV